MSVVAGNENLERDISKQIEFYFSDANLLRDKFLRQKIAEDDGWVSIETLLSFNRLKNLTTDPNVIINALKKHENGLIEIESEKLKVRRAQSVPIPNKSFRKFFEEKQDLTIYLSPFPLDYTIEEVTKYLDTHNIKRQFVKLIRNKDKTFSGCVYVILENEANYKTVTSPDTILIVNDKKLLIQTREEYVKTKETDETKNLTENGSKSESNETGTKFVPFKLLRLKNLSEGVSRESIKETLSKYQKLAWVDFNRGDKDGVIILDEEGSAKTLLAIFAEKKEPLIINNSEVQMELIEGEEERKYWEDRITSSTNTKKNQAKRKAASGGKAKKIRKN